MTPRFLPIPDPPEVSGTPDPVGGRRPAAVNTDLALLAADASLLASSGDLTAAVSRRTEALVPGLVARTAGGTAGGAVPAVGSCAPPLTPLAAHPALDGDQATLDALTVAAAEVVQLAGRHFRLRRALTRARAALIVAAAGLVSGASTHVARLAIARCAGASVPGTSSM